MTPTPPPLHLVGLLGLLVGCVQISDAEYEARLGASVDGDTGCDDEDIWYTDGDGDGYGDPRGAVSGCTQPAGTVDNYDDCDDSNPEINDVRTWYRDEDGDGYGGVTSTTACAQPPNYVLDPGDCDDTLASVNPEGTEACNGEDDDCDGDVDEDAVDAALWYRDEDGDGFGNTAQEQLACERPDGFVDNSDDCLDTSDTTYPGAEEICGDGLDNDCDEDPLDCGFTGDIDLLDEGEAWTGASGARAGESLGLGSDLTGDGAPDLVLGAPRADVGTGRVHIVAGPVTAGGDLDGGLSLTGDDSGDQAGWAVDLPGDVDGDGFDDLLVGARFADTTDSLAGAVVLVHGPITASGALSAAGPMLSGLAASDRLGTSVRSSDDLTGDGVADLLVGALGVESATGAAYVVAGPVTGSADVSGAFRLLGAAGDRAGYALLAPGDLTGDGLADVLVGAYQSQGDAEPFYAGATYVVEGPVTASANLEDVAVATIRGLVTFEGSSGALAAGDFDGDGAPDLAIGSAPYGSYAGSGAVWVVSGPVSGGAALGPSATGTLQGDASGDRFGYALHAGDDLDGDGRSELLVGAPGANASSGGAYLFYGPISGSGLASDADASLAGFGSAEAGTAVSIGDANGDTPLDLLIGAPSGSVEGAILIPGRGL